MRIFVFIFLIITYIQGQQNIYINEFLASNVTTNADLFDYDDFSDWIELYNNTDHTLDIGGYYLSDDPDNPYRWQIPAGTMIEADSFLLFWADGYDDVPGKTHVRDYYPNWDFTTKYYHLNFKLSRATEWIGLSNPDSLLIDSVYFNLQYPDISYGRQQDGWVDWVFFAEPTPGSSNIGPTVSVFEESETAQVSLKSGFYSESQIINVSTLSQNAIVTYTLDGSKPGLLSTTYTDAIEINDTDILKVRVFEENKIPGKIVTRSYFINENVTLPVMSLTVDPGFFWDNEIGIYNNTLKQREVPINFELFDSLGNSQYHLDAGLSLTGQASVLYPQKSFTISARDRFGGDAFNYQFFPTRKQNNFKDIYLRNGGVPDHRNTIFRDGLQATIIENKMDLDYQAYIPHVVFINGQYWGIYNLRDKINVDQLAIKNNINPDDIDLLEYEIDPSPHVMDGNKDNFEEMYNYIQNADLTVEDQYQVVASWIDIDEYINYQIAEIYYDNTNAVDQNVRMWRERKDNRKWRWILYDMDYGFGMPNQRSTGYTNNTLKFVTSSNFNSVYVPPLWSTLVFRKLLENENFKNNFIQRFAGYMNTVFHPDTVLNIIDSLQNRLYPEMNRNILRWRNDQSGFGNPIQSMGEWLDNVNVMKNFARFRPAYQRNHILDFFNLDGMIEIYMNVSENNTGAIYVNEVIKTEASHHGPYFNNVPLSLKAVPNVGYRFVKWQGLQDSLSSEVIFTPDDESMHISAIFEKDDINILPQLIKNDTTLSLENSPYYANNDIFIDSSSIVIIDSGVEILMPAGKSIIVNGNLKINGSVQNPVIIKPNSFSESWGALCFVNSTDTSVVNHLKIVGTTTGIDFARDKAAISAYNSHIVLNNVVTENVQLPFFAQYGSIKISACSLSAQTAGDLINIKHAKSTIVEKCDLQGNDFFDSDAIDFDNLNNGIIRNNHIYNFSGFNSDAIDLGESAKEILVEGNVVYNINDKGISIGGASTAVIRRNVFANCGQGAGIKDFGSYGYFEHNTFYSNQIGIASFVKNTGSGGGRADAVNCIFANSITSPLLVDAESYLNVSYSLSNTEKMEGLHNIFAEPLFQNDLFLSTTSAAVNSGNPTLPLDPDGSLPDMGAYPLDPDYESHLIINEIHYNPAEGPDFEFIEIVNTSNEAINLAGFKISGDIDYTFSEFTIGAKEFLLIAKNSANYTDKDYRVLQWDNGNLQAGAGSIILYNDQNEMVDFVHYDVNYWWPSEANGNGPSLELLKPTLENMVSLNWRSSYNNGGTPGKSNNSKSFSGIYINEFLASNLSNITDENDEHDDWIEIYNQSDTEINLAGLYLTDKMDNLSKYWIPNTAQTIVPAKGYILFWADEQSSQGSNHLNFKLDKNGEWIGLVQLTISDTVFFDSISYGPQFVDTSYGRVLDGSSQWDFLTQPSPLDSNYTGKKYEPILPDDFGLSQNYPNPFNNRTTISYQLPVDSKIEISIFNILGQKVVTLLKKQQPAESYKIEWDASSVASGIYFYQLKTDKGFIKTRKLLLLK